MGTPHDSLFHFAFRHPHHAAAWLRACLPQALAAAIDWATLRLCSGRVHGLALRHGETDVVHEALLLGVDAGIFLLIEHRSFRDDLLEAKLVRYAVHLGHGPRRQTEAPPVPVITVVLYHGPGSLSPRRGPPLPAITPAARDVLAGLPPRLEWIADELTGRTEAELLARQLTALGTLTLLCLHPPFSHYEGGAKMPL